MSLLLAIESSCDETAAAVIDRNLNVRSSIVASQVALHERYGGVVPEIASRAHVENILPVIDEALREANATLADLAAVAVMTEPGLVGSLLIGLTAAKTLAWTLELPLIAVNHIEAHIYACRMVGGASVFPAVGLVVSGGHSNLYNCASTTELELVGSTIDDAAGEAFDKVAQILGLPYPGGPFVQECAESGDAAAIKFPRTFLRDERLAFSFSGLKTAVLYAVQGNPGSRKPVPKMTEQRRHDIAAGFQEAVVDVLVGKCEQALERFGRDSLCVGGGVAANARLRARLQEMSDRRGSRLVIAPMQLCTDNAAMAAMAWEHLDAGRIAALDLDVRPGLVRLNPNRR